MRLIRSSKRAATPAPVLNNAVDTALGPTSATISVDLTGGDDAGNVFWVELLTADSTPSAAQIEDGLKADGSTPAEDDGSKAVTGDGTITPTTKPTMLNPETGYKTAFVYKNGSGTYSNVVVADGFTTLAIVKGQLTGGGASTTNPTVATGSVVVAAGDYVIAIASEQSGPAVTAVTDNLGNTYTAQNAGTANSTVSGRMFYTKVTNAGTLTAVNFAAAATANDIAVNAIVFNGPFGDVDTNPANRTDSTSNFITEATGTLAQASELMVGWFAGVSTVDTLTANAPRIMAGSVVSGGLRVAAICHENVEATDGGIASFAGTNSIAVCGIMSIKRAV